MNLFDRVKFFLATTSKVKLIALGTLALVILAIPLTVFIASQQQDIRQRATTSAAPAKPPTRHMYINGTSPQNNQVVGPGAPWSADAQVAAMCAKVGRSPCYPDIISQQPINWDTGAFPEETQLISIGNRFWVRGPFTQFGWGAALQLGRYYYINGAVTTRTFIAENGDVGPGKLWWDMSDIQWMCQQAGKNSAADCKPDIVSQTPTGWDNLPESTQILGFGNKVWVRGPFKGTNGNNPPYGRTYYIKGDNTAAVDVCTTDRAGAACPVSNLGPGATWWKADTAMQTMCQAAGLGEAACKPSILTTLPSGWDLFTGQTQLIGINNKVWLRSTIKRVGGATFRTYYNLGGGQQANPTEPGTGAHWYDVDKQIAAMCKAVNPSADGNSCQPQMIVQLPIGWDGSENGKLRFPTASQLISMHNGTNDKLWVRGPVFAASYKTVNASGNPVTPLAGQPFYIQVTVPKGTVLPQSLIDANQYLDFANLVVKSANSSDIKSFTSSNDNGGNLVLTSAPLTEIDGSVTVQLFGRCDPNAAPNVSTRDCLDPYAVAFTGETITIGLAPTATPTLTPTPTPTPGVPGRLQVSCSGNNANLTWDASANAINGQQYQVQYNGHHWTTGNVHYTVPLDNNARSNASVSVRPVGTTSFANGTINCPLPTIAPTSTLTPIPTVTPTPTPTLTPTPTTIPTFTISGRVYDETGSSTTSYAGSTEINLYHADSNGTVLTRARPVKSQPITNGTYSLSGVPQGNYRLTLTMPTGYERATGYDDSFAILPLNTNLNRDFGIKLLRYTITTRALLDSNSTLWHQSLGSVNFVLTPPGGGIPQVRTSDGSANYTFTNLLPGTYTLGLNAPNPSTHTLSNSQNNVAITVGPNASHDFLVKTIPPVVTLIDASPTAITIGSTVRYEWTVTNNPSSCYLERYNGSDWSTGKIQLDTSPSNVQQVNVFSSPWGTPGTIPTRIACSNAGGTGYSHGNTDITGVNPTPTPTVTPTPTPTLTLTPTTIPTFTISGRVYDETGSSTTSYTGQATITLHKADNNGTIIAGPTRNPTVTNGTYSLSGVPQGNYRLTLTMPTGYERATGYDDSFAILPLNTNLNRDFGIRQIPTPTTIPAILCERKAGGYPITCQYVAATNNNDFRHWASHVGRESTLGRPEYLTADYDGNGTVNILDFNRWRSRKFGL